MKLGTLCSLAGLETPSDTRMAACEISAIAMDSRALVPGCIFVCIRGARADGHAYIEQAIAQGAAAVVVERDVSIMKDSGAVFIRVHDTRRALACLCHAFYLCPSTGMKLIAVTGTNGKTSVSTMLKAIFDAAMIPTGLIGTVRCLCGDRELRIRPSDPRINMTTPDPIELYHMLAVMRDEGIEVVIMEATSHALALHKLEPLTFDAAVFTNLTPEHLDFHADMAHYFAAKATLFERARVAVLNVDDPAGLQLCGLAKGRAVRCSCTGRDAEYHAEATCFHGADGVSYTLRSARAMVQLSCSIPGLFTLPNTLQAAACALEMGIGIKTVREALGTLQSVTGRMERVKLGVPVDFSVFIDYAHTPDALENLLLTARGFCEPHGRVVLLFGCGGDRDRSKRALMGRIASCGADMVYLTADNSRSERVEDIVDDILCGMDQSKPYCVIYDRAAAIRAAIADARRGDIILLAGKGHEAYEIDDTGKHPFDEKAIAARAAADAHPFADGVRTDEGKT